MDEILVSAATFAGKCLKSKKYGLRIFRINEELKEALRRQRQTVFGKGRYWFHIAAWIAAVLLLAFNDSSDDFMSGFKTGLVTIKTNRNIPITTSLLLAGIGGGIIAAAMMTYFFLLWVIPVARYRKRKRILWLGLFLNILLYILLFAGLIFMTGMLVGDKDKETGIRVIVGLGTAAGVAAAFSGYFFAIYYFLDLYDQQEELNRYQKVFADKLQAESSFLKTQINPHFLFNTLNNIYSLTLTRSDNAAAMTRRLKELLTYMLYDCEKDMVPLEGELAFLMNYMALEQLRNSRERIDIQLNIAGNPRDLKIAPLLLINFIENAFKHGVKAGIDKAYVHANLYIMDNLLSVDITNSKPPSAGETLAVHQGGGIGISNVCRRLELLYPGTHRLRIAETKTDYSIHLDIEL